MTLSKSSRSQHATTTIQRYIVAWQPSISCAKLCLGLFSSLVRYFCIMVYRKTRTIAHLSHPNIVRVLNFEVEVNIPFLVMEYALIRKSMPGGRNASDTISQPVIFTIKCNRRARTYYGCSLTWSIRSNADRKSV